ncbi:hypothetical protein GCM10017044_17510 [Kordiimonas sediminis]|uniref:JAB domain-containing protein n=2 Tax=Kordiimonas sediminis TaxID=1735581 RepID=A0A919E8H4_9PROT|nr:hypothetical protein GCM10017044_17510 [Kordiimonas sediminis]
MYAPEEACALLTGYAYEECFTVTAAVMSPNVSDRDRTKFFEIDPAVHIKAQKKLRNDQGKTEIIGVWHSHPGGKTEPSVTDKASSTQGNFVWMISVPGPSVQTQAYVTERKDPTKFCQVDILID